MNKQIRKLAIQAGAYWNHEDFNMGCSVEFQEVDLEKFAELIVRECAFLVNHQQRTTGYTTHAKMLCDEFGIEFNEEDFFGDKE